MYYLEQACRIQVTATQGGQKITLPPPDVSEHTAAQFDGFAAQSPKGQRPWKALRRKLDRISTGLRHATRVRGIVWRAVPLA